MTRAPDLLVFSDLDGTLLDHHDYSWAAAKPGLQRLSDLKAGLVLASSKTAAEILPLRQELGLFRMPAIVENGSGILWPDQPNSGETCYAKLRASLAELPKGFEGFGDMSDSEIANLTGLDPQQASLARQRRFSEPGLWTGSTSGLEAFLAAAQEHGLHARQGGRFLTLSFGSTKADAMREVISHFTPRLTIALGDAPNDREMLELADHGVVVHNPHSAGISQFPSDTEAHILRTKQAGPQGWSDAILALTRDL